MNDAARQSCPRVNVGLIGAGFMGKAHSLAYAAMPMFFWPAPAIPRRKVVVDVTAELAESARAAWDALTGGAGPEVVTQWRVQLFCWDHLTRWGADAAERWQVATGLAALLEALGMERYAGLAG